MNAVEIDVCPECEERHEVPAKRVSASPLVCLRCRVKQRKAELNVDVLTGKKCEPKPEPEFDFCSGEELLQDLRGVQRRSPRTIKKGLDALAYWFELSREDTCPRCSKAGMLCSKVIEARDQFARLRDRFGCSPDCDRLERAQL